MSISKIISIDLAKDVFEVAVANRRYRIEKRHRLTRPQFSRSLSREAPALVLMEACGGAHAWARQAQAAGHTVRLIPAQYVKPYRRRGKSDRIDTEAILEAYRCQGIQPVPVRSVEQQTIQQLHRAREQWKNTRNRRLNTLRGCLREFGVAAPLGPAHAKRATRQAIDDVKVPVALHPTLLAMLEEIESLEQRVKGSEKQLHALTKSNPEIQALRQVGGVGLLTATATVAAVGSPHYFKQGRQLACWVGMTPREFASGNQRYLGRISKQGNKYLRTLFIHGARSVLAGAKRRRKAGKSLNRIQHWALQLQQRVGHNKAACALANKLIRICWAVWKHQRPFDPNFAAA